VGVSGLFHLQQLDTEIARVSAHRAGLNDGAPERAAASEAAQRLTDLQGEIAARQTRLRALDLELQSLQSKRKKVETDLYSGRVGNPKELASMQEELSALDRSKARLEDEVLGLLDEVERLEPQHREAQARLVASQAALAQHKDLSEQARWVVHQHTAMVVRLTAEIGQVEAHLEAIAGNDWMVRQLLTCKGIGLVTAGVIRAEVGSFQRFKSAKSLARYCALTPRNASSGARQADAGVIQAGNRMLRTILIEAAHRLARFEPRWKALAAALRGRGKHGNVIAVAIANRWMRSLYHQGKNLERAAA